MEEAKTKQSHFKTIAISEEKNNTYVIENMAEK